MTQDELKQKVAESALDYIEFDDVVGVGTGSTVNYFIDALVKVKGKIDGAVASSKATEERLKANGIRVLDLNQTGNIPVYIDGADEATTAKHLIKGGGAALTREKIVAEASEKFICIVDESKVVDVLGAFPLPVEVIPMAQSLVARKLIGITGTPSLREGVTTDNGNVILDLGNAKILNPVELEKQINNIPGVVTNGLFAIRCADVLLVGRSSGDIEKL